MSMARTRRLQVLPFRAGGRLGAPTRQSGHRRFAGWLNHNRRLVVALLLCVAAGIAVHQLTPPSEQRVTVLAAARDLPAGSTLMDSDLKPLEVLPDGVPAGALSPKTGYGGKQLASPLRKGQIPTDAQLLGPGLLTGTAPATAAVPLRMADPASIQLISPGQVVDVVLTAADGPEGPGKKSELLASAVPVLWTSGQGGKATQWLGTNEADGLVVVAANPQQAEILAGASTRGKLFFVLVNPSDNRQSRAPAG
ncbi:MULTISPECIES: Flp pilus assembly protein CpaB [Arthrobacter]|jgi:pilus assembly protein CpaB|uniref:Flp pilus assembly protein CpaB n=2 Tax=Arthrobacter bambusae TaxID=1338426 RepID=A0AAW8DDI7_9MICC|nr:MULTISPECIES: Flp pilus assembly protein CpaB [Arthrobacter]MDP9903355.1 Flp pilus assembly protein CpaB [Arthrobacter bambusae]MDQ0128651.1 Flp pilus assembly protein CpaB [Arthrobacter bambusae]MDQ0179992.1 Flp pilus assembly protein CpaB [Arthrobacter bambusae]MDQ0238153.1 Flp pilus assembly protein CpaB [Arthrobacter bambusae]